jgi:hypothetical protein
MEKPISPEQAYWLVLRLAGLLVRDVLTDPKALAEGRPPEIEVTQADIAEIALAAGRLAAELELRAVQTYDAHQAYVEHQARRN